MIIIKKNSLNFQQQNIKSKKITNILLKKNSPNILTTQSKILFQLNKYYNKQIQTHQKNTIKTIHKIYKIIQNILKKIKIQKPKFINSLNKINKQFKNLNIISPNKFKIILYLNQINIFNFINNKTIPNYTILKLNNKQKKSISL